MTARSAADLARLGIPCICGHALDEHDAESLHCAVVWAGYQPCDDCEVYIPDEDRICRECDGHGGWTWTVEVNGRDRDDERECRTCGGMGIVG